MPCSGRPGTGIAAGEELGVATVVVVGDGWTDGAGVGVPDADGPGVDVAEGFVEGVPPVGVAPEPPDEHAARSTSSVAVGRRRRDASTPRWKHRASTAARDRGQPSSNYLYFTIRANSSGSRLAPPTSAPSTSGWAMNPRMFPAFTLPPYWTRTAWATSPS